MAASPRGIRDFALPAPTGEVVAVHVNGVPAMPGRDYCALPARLRFARPLVPRQRMGWRRQLLVALCASAEPRGDEVDVTLRRDGDLVTVALEPAQGQPGDRRTQALSPDGDCP